MGHDDFFDGVYEPGLDARAHYGRWAGRYDEALESKGYAQPRRVAKMAARLRGRHDAPVLDVGCGTGLSGSALLAAGFATVDGCDFSDEMLSVASTKDVYRRTFWADLNDPPIDATDGAYDLVSAAGVFGGGHLGPDAVDELIRVVQPGGVIVIGVNDHYWNEGDLADKLDGLAGTGTIDMLAPEAGEHLPGIDLAGWVLGIVKGNPD